MDGMTRGVGGSSAPTELARLGDRLGHCQPIPEERLLARLEGLRARMKAAKLDAVWLNAGTNLTYYTGLRWRASERLVGALVTADGGLTYLGPAFETGTLEGFMQLHAPLATWEEHEDPHALLASAHAGDQDRDAGGPCSGGPHPASGNLDR